MPLLRRPNPSFIPLVFAALFAGAGCDQSPMVVQYDIPLSAPVEFAQESDRRLGALVPIGDQVWFYKVTGPKSEIDSVEKTLRKFVETVTYDDGEPKLDDLPGGWRRQSGERDFRFATVDIPVDGDAASDDLAINGKMLDLSISSLSRQEDYDEMVVMNVNRWRDQMGLPASNDKFAGGELIEVDSADGQSVWVDLTGKSGDGPMMGGGMAGGPFSDGPFSSGPASGGAAGDTAASKPFVDGDQMLAEDVDSDPSDSGSGSNQLGSDQLGSEVTAGSDGSDGPVRFTKPEPWRPGRGSSMRLAAFNAGPEDAVAEITVIPAGGDLRPNVARWIGQIRGDSPPEDVVDAAMESAEKLSVDGRDGQRFLLLGETDTADAIDATVISLDDGFSLFVKMTGPSATVKAETKRIGDFLNSMKINL